MDSFKETCDSFAVEDIHATATSAVREAENGADFCRDVKERTGIHIRVINGTEEARLIYLGARADLDFSRGRVMLFDLGGGSTELILCDAETPLLTISLPLGHIRLTDAHHAADGPLTDAGLEEMTKTIRRSIRPLAARVHTDDFNSLVGTSGTARALARLATAARGDIIPEHSHGLVLHRSELDDLIGVFQTLSAAKLARMPGMDARRAKTLPSGAVLVREIMDTLGKKRLVTSELSLRDGLVADWVRRHHPEVSLLGTVSDPRRRAVMAMMKRYRVDVKHAEQTARLATEIFDATVLVHGLRIDDRRILEFAALLHDVGHHISGKDHHKHGQYLIRHTRMPGFTSPEVAVLGNLVRYHRSGKAKQGHAEFAALDAVGRDRVNGLAAILCLADALDRGHNQSVQGIDVTVSKERVHILARTRDAGHLERWAAVRRCEPLSRLLGLPVEIELD